jgi:hypothetical protein
MTFTIRIILRTSLLATAWLAGCGGGSEASPPHAADALRAVPASASQSVAGLVNYLDSLPSLDTQTLEPVSLDAFSPKTSEDTEPHPVDG